MPMHAKHFGEARPEQERDQTRIPLYVGKPEEAEIRERRRVMFPSRSAVGASAPLRDAVGLALSGGGIRSASFNLGLLQAFLEKGLVRWMDYLSTVSGGGFMGTYLSTLLCHQGTTKLQKDLPLVPKPGEQAPEPVERFIRGGRYLQDAPMMADRVLFGLLCSVALWGSLLVFFTATIAFAWRWLDYPPLIPWVQNHVPVIGRYYTDLGRPFIPFFLLLAVWLISWILTYASGRFAPRHDATRKSGQWLLKLAVPAFSVAVAVLLATDGIQVERLLGEDDSSGLSQRLSGHDVFVDVVLLSFIVINLLPFLNPLRIARSELRPVGKTESAVLRFAGGSLLLILPFYLTFLFSKEGISHYQTRRGPDFVAADIPFPFDFIKALQKGHRQWDDNVIGKYVHGACSNDLFSRQMLAASDVPSGEQGQTTADVTHGYPGLWERVNGNTLQDALRNACRSHPELSRLLEAKEFHSSISSGRLDALLAFADALNDTKGGEHVYDYRTRNLAKSLCSTYVAATLNDLLEKEEITRIALKMVQSGGRAGDGNAQAGGPPTNASEAFRHRASRLREGRLLLDQLLPKALVTDVAISAQDRKKLNRLILEVCYAGDYLEERTKAGYTLLWRDDQWRRFWWMLGSLSAFLVLGLLVDLNATSLHGYYRKKLEDAYVVRGTEGELLSNLHTTRVGGPYHFLCGTMNFFDDWPWKQTEYTSAYTFFFSRLFCGSQALPRYAETDRYCQGQFDVATAAAISGAAFSPAILRSPLLFCLAMLLNLRLGQWVPNPSKFDNRRRSHRNRRITVFPVLRDFILTKFKLREPKNWEYCFVTDGGHNDNLGVAPLIFRRCRLLIISDATMDPTYNFGDFMKAYRRYRIRGGMRFCRLEKWRDLLCREQTAGLLELEALRPSDVVKLEQTELQHDWFERFFRRWRQVEQRTAKQPPNRSQRHFLLSKFTYPNQKDKDTIVVYLKTTMTGDEAADLRQYQIDHPLFPHDPTTDQFFTENQVESYRQLGQHIGSEVCATILRGREVLGLEQGKEEDLWQADFTAEDVVELLLAGHLEELPQSPEELLELLDEIEYPRLGLHLATTIAQRSGGDARQLRTAMFIVLRHLKSEDEPALSFRLQAAAMLARALRAAADHNVSDEPRAIRRQRQIYRILHVSSRFVSELIRQTGETREQGTAVKIDPVGSAAVAAARAKREALEQLRLEIHALLPPEESRAASPRDANTRSSSAETRDAVDSRLAALAAEPDVNRVAEGVAELSEYPLDAASLERLSAVLEARLLATDHENSREVLADAFRMASFLIKDAIREDRIQQPDVGRILRPTRDRLTETVCDSQVSPPVRLAATLALGWIGVASSKRRRMLREAMSAEETPADVKKEIENLLWHEETVL